MGLGKQVGCVNGLAVYGASQGMIVDIEVSTSLAKSRQGLLTVTGIIEQEEVENRGQKLKRTSSARASVENVLTVIKKHLGVEPKDYDIHINFPGGIPIDGPSAGISIAMAVYSSITNLPIDSDIALTGEISIRGKVKPVGGVPAKIEAARIAGVKRIIIPKDNWQANFSELSVEVIAVNDIMQVLDIVFDNQVSINRTITQGKAGNLLSAQGKSVLSAES